MVQQYQRITAALVFGCILWLLVKTWMYDRRRLRLSRRSLCWAQRPACLELCG